MKYYKSIMTLLSAASLAALLQNPLLSLAEEDTEYSSSITQGIYEIRSALNEDYILDVTHCTDKEEVQNLKTLQLYQDLDINQQRFYVEDLKDSGWRITVLENGEALTTSGEASSWTDFVGGDADSSDQRASLTANSGFFSDTIIESIEVADSTEPAEPETESTADAAEPDPSVYYTSVSTAASEQTQDGTAVNKQIWILEAVEGKENTCTIRSLDGNYLTVDNFSAGNGAPVNLQPYSGKENQQWILQGAQISTQDTADTDSVNPYAEGSYLQDLTIMLRLGTDYESISASDLAAHMTQTEHAWSLDPEYISSWVKDLAASYDTQGLARPFKTTDGRDLTISGGNFGWLLDQNATAEAINAELDKSSKTFIDPVWSHKGVSLEKNTSGTINDIGDSYVEVDMTAQKVWLYVDGEQILESDCVTGTYNDSSRRTPEGVNAIYYMQSPAVLNGPGYSSPVTYWMAFNGGYGLHDANWRSEFGGDIYLNNGSHGCVNLPTDTAQKLYETVSYGFPVVTYY